MNIGYIDHLFNKRKKNIFFPYNSDRKEKYFIRKSKFSIFNSLITKVMNKKNFLKKEEVMNRKIYSI